MLHYFIIVALSCQDGPEPTTSKVEQDRTDSMQYDAETGIYFQIDEHPNTTLGAVIRIESDTDVALQVQVSALDQEAWRTSLTTSGTSHDISVLGLRSQKEYLIEPLVIDENGNELAIEPTYFTTGLLPPQVADFEVEILRPDEMEKGITLFGMNMEDVYGIGVDHEGEVVWYHIEEQIERSTIVRQIKPLADGNFLILIGGGLKIISPDGHTKLHIESEDLDNQSIHHDAIALPNGNYMVIVAEVREVSSSTLGGVYPLRGDRLLEVRPNGEIVWSWSTFEHISTNRFPSNLSTNTGPGQNNPQIDWTHGNGLFFDAENDRVLFSMRSQSWVVSIDYMTGHIVWHMGSGGNFQLESGDWFYAQHVPLITSDGKFLIYDNGNERPNVDGNYYSRAVIYDFDESDMTVNEVWSYTTDYFTPRLGSAIPLENGNILICAGSPHRSTEGHAQLIEVNEAAEEVWRLSAPSQNIYRAYRIKSFSE